MVRVQMVSCVNCKRVMDWALMPDAESPQTVFQFLYTKVPRARKLRLSYDNGCNFVHYVLNRDPGRMETLQVNIDAFHHEGHTCSKMYTTGERPPLLWLSQHAGEDRATSAVLCFTTLTARMLYLVHSALGVDTCTPLTGSLHAGRYKGKGQGALYEDTPLAERRNIPLGSLRTAAAHMSQFTLLFRLELHFDNVNRKCRSPGGQP